MKERIEAGSYLPGRESSLKTTVGGESITSLCRCEIILSPSKAQLLILFESCPVYYCGPSPLAVTLKAATKSASLKSIKFSFAKEHFVS